MRAAHEPGFAEYRLASLGLGILEGVRLVEDGDIPYPLEARGEFAFLLDPSLGSAGQFLVIADHEEPAVFHVRDGVHPGLGYEDVIGLDQPLLGLQLPVEGEGGGCHH